MKLRSLSAAVGQFGPVGLDVGSRAIKAVQCSGGPGRWRVEAAVCIPRAEPGAALSEREMRRTLGVLERRGFRTEQFNVCAPAGSLVAATMELPPRTSGAPIHQIARGELSRAHKRDPDQLEVALWDIPTPARGGEGSHVYAVACPHDTLEALLAVFDGLDLRVGAIDVRSCAMARACEPAARGLKGMFGVLEIGWTGGMLALVHEGAVVYERVMEEAGVGPLHKRVCGALDADSELVDHVLGTMELRSPPTQCRRSVETLGRAGKIVSAFIENVAKELQLSLAYIATRYPQVQGEGGQAVSKLLVGGGAASMPGLVSRLGETLGVDCRVAAATDLAQVAPGHEHDASSPGLLAALGLAERGGEGWE